MLLKTLSLVGFKSFADRTRLDFDEGINVVVGPNGSGKSNLLDALAWVMGTQGTRTLRTHKMEDVIFAGTATRPALGRAEVTLTFDNTDRFLPLDLDEVAMTRRLYRDGTSEYELNGTPCRLLDLSELLSDGGVGRHQHVLVSQGQIGEILNARPDEHRAVIEEAAGITKHRGRRDRSVRRLEQTDIDVARLTDLLDEQRKRLRPLKRQANAAARYDGVKDQARALRLWLGGEVLRNLRERLRVATEESDTLAVTLTAQRSELEAIEAGLGGLREAAGAVGKSLERDTAAAARLETVTERFHRIAMVAKERRSGLESRLAGAADRTQDLETELEHLEGEIEESSRLQLEAEVTAERAEVTLRALEDEERALSEQAQMPVDGVVASLRGDLSALEAASARDRREAEAINHRIEVVSARIEAEADELGSLAEQIETTDAAATSAQDAYAICRDTRLVAQTAWETADEAHGTADVTLERGLARLEAVESAIAGVGDPAGRERAERSALTLGAVIAQLDVPAHIAPAVDAALGPWRDALMTEDGSALETMVADLKSNGFGGVGLVVTPDAGTSCPARDVATAMSSIPT